MTHDSEVRSAICDDLPRLGIAITVSTFSLDAGKPNPSGFRPPSPKSGLQLGPGNLASGKTFLTQNDCNGRQHQILRGQAL